MAKLIEKDGKSIVVTENEIGLSDLDNSIKIIQTQIDNIDYNMKGLVQRREALSVKLDQLNAIKDSLTTKTETTTLEPQA